jgi:hypothetical protein
MMMEMVEEKEAKKRSVCLRPYDRNRSENFYDAR